MSTFTRNRTRPRATPPWLHTGKLPAAELTTGTDLNISEGFALFPNLGTIRAFKQWNSADSPLADYDTMLDQYGFSFHLDVNAFFGIAGPAYAVDIQTTSDSDWGSNSVTGTHVNIQMSSARFAAGIEAGLTLGAAIDCFLTDTSTNPPQDIVAVFPVTVTVDVINLLVQLIEAALDEEGTPSPLSKLDNLTNNGVLSSWAIYDETDNPFEDSTVGTALTTTLQPSFTLPINIVPLLDGVPFADVLPAIDAGLAEVGGGFSFGPSFVFGIPVTIKVAEVHLDEDTLAASGCTVTQIGPLASFASSSLPVRTSAPSAVGLTFEHTVSFSFGVGFFGNIQVAKLFNAPYNSPTLDVLDLFDIPSPTFGPYDNTLTYSATDGTPEPGAPATAPVVKFWEENQPWGIWTGGVLGQYAVTFTNGSYESGLGPWSPADPHSDIYALGSLIDVPTDPFGLASGRNVYRTFGDGTETLVGSIPDNTTTTFVDNSY